MHEGKGWGGGIHCVLPAAHIPQASTLACHRATRGYSHTSSKGHLRPSSSRTLRQRATCGHSQQPVNGPPAAFPPAHCVIGPPAATQPACHQATCGLSPRALVIGPPAANKQACQRATRGLAPAHLVIGPPAANKQLHSLPSGHLRPSPLPRSVSTGHPRPILCCHRATCGHSQQPTCHQATRGHTASLSPGHLRPFPAHLVIGPPAATANQPVTGPPAATQPACQRATRGHPALQKTAFTAAQMHKALHSWR
jgi:hypothetical protein